MLLEIRQLSKNFGKLAALSNVSFGIEEGEIFGIAGPNGAGKSTLFNVIAGVYSPTTGKVFFREQDITGLRPHQVCHKRIARTFQVPSTFHSLSVYDNVRVGATFGSGNKVKIEETLTFLGLKEKAALPTTNLDLYTTKLVMLGAALATDCSLLMLDEPMAGLSIVEIEDFVSLVHRINREMKVTILIIEHLLDILSQMSNRMMILDNGERIAMGAPRDVLQDRRVVEGYLGAGGKVA